MCAGSAPSGACIRQSRFRMSCTRHFLEEVCFVQTTHENSKFIIFHCNAGISPVLSHDLVTGFSQAA